MSSSPKYYIVEASALPEVFLKVAEAKRLLQVGEAATVNEATRMTGISRSAFYKYQALMTPKRTQAAMLSTPSVPQKCKRRLVRFLCSDK